MWAYLVIEHLRTFQSSGPKGGHGLLPNLCACVSKRHTDVIPNPIDKFN